jgi:sec-independent protein translocase protein TatB
VFDVGFWELVLIFVVALIVVGPERLPGLARTVGLWLGRARRFLASVKADIDRELRAEELKRILDKQARSPGLEEILEDTKSALRTAEGASTAVPPKAPQRVGSEGRDTRSSTPVESTDEGK